VFSSKIYIFMFQIKEDEVSRACSIHGWEKECIQDFGGKAKRRETTKKTWT
jgi:hypothetical protein